MLVVVDGLIQLLVVMAIHALTGAGAWASFDKALAVAFLAVRLFASAALLVDLSLDGSLELRLLVLDAKDVQDQITV